MAGGSPGRIWAQTCEGYRTKCIRWRSALPVCDACTKELFLVFADQKQSLRLVIPTPTAGGHGCNVSALAAHRPALEKCAQRKIDSSRYALAELNALQLKSLAERRTLGLRLKSRAMRRTLLWLGALRF